MRLTFPKTGMTAFSATVLSVAALSLAACGREDSPPPAEEAVPTEEAPLTVPPPRNDTAPGTTMDTTPLPDDPVTEPIPGAVTDETRDNAKARAESTNLHPRTE